MKKTHLSLLICLISSCLLTKLPAQTPSIVQLADPFILLDGDTYYAYGTNDANGIAYWTSTDLIGWSKGNELALHKNNTTENQWFWAPEVYFVHGRYYMYYSANEHLFVATSTSPRGPFKQVGGYMMQNTLGDEKCIDSTVYFDDNGKVYLFFVRFTDGNCIWMCELEDDLVTPKPETLRKCINVSQPWEDLLGRVNEGPFILKHNNIYYLTYSGNDYRSQDYAVGYAQTRSLNTAGGATPTWQKYGGNPILRRVENLVGTGHHSVFTDKEGRLRIVFHAHNTETVVNPRRMYIGTLEFTGNRLSLTDEPIIRPTTPERAAIDAADASTPPKPIALYDLAGRPIAMNPSYSSPVTGTATYAAAAPPLRDPTFVIAQMADGTVRKQLNP